jgi:Leucine-rich repeat (LRR) protein
MKKIDFFLIFLFTIMNKIRITYNNEETQLISNINEININSDIITIDCSCKAIDTLNELPQSLKRLYCEDNKITSLDYLPSNLYVLYCSMNKIISLNKLSQSLKILYCEDNKLHH